MKFMLNGALTLGTMDGANVEIVEEVGKEHAFIFGLSADEVINFENHGGYDPYTYYNSNPAIHRVVDQLVDGTFSQGDHNRFRDIYDSLLSNKNSSRADMYFILADFQSYLGSTGACGEQVQNSGEWAKSAILNISKAGKFSSDRNNSAVCG